MIKSLLMRLFMVLASFSLCHLSEFLISSLSTIWSLFIFPHLLIIPRFLFILFSLFLCCATSAYLFRLYLRLYVGCSYFFLLVLSLLFLCVFLSFLIFSLFLAMCNISRWESAFELYLCLLCFDFLFFSSCFLNVF